MGFKAFKIKSKSWYRRIFGILLLLGFFGALYNNCAKSFRATQIGSNDLSSIQGGDNGGIRPPGPTTTTTTTVPRNTTTTTLPSVTTTSTTLPTGTTTTTTTLPAVTLVSCNSAVFQLPVATHWSNANGGAVIEGASDAYRVDNPDGNSNRIYNFGILPEYEKYIGDVFSIEKLADLDVRTWSTDQCVKYGIAVDVKKPSSYSNWGIAKSAASARRGALQIIPALVVNKSLMTIILPVDWDPQAPAGTYPVIFNGAYDVHANMRLEGNYEISAIANLWRTKNLKAIGIVWNGMGAVASRTMNEGALAEFNTLIQRAGTYFGADPQRIVTFGGSRGGLTSLRIASNPLNFPYKVKAAYAAVPPDQVGTIGKLTSATVPALIYAASWSIGFKDTFLPGWTYPNVGNSLTGLTTNEAHVKILTGTSDLVFADANYSLSSARYIQALKNSGTQVFLEIGSHDFIVPWIDQFNYARVLEANGIPHELRVNYLAGHWQDSTALEQTLNQALDKVSSGSSSSYFSIGRKSYYRVNELNGQVEPVSKQMFTLELPKKILPGASGFIVATGIPGTKFKFQFSFNGSSLVDFERTLDNTGRFIEDISAIDDGSYRIEKLFIQEPGNAMRELSLNRKTSKVDGAFLTVQKSSAPFVGAASDLFLNILRGYTGPNDEYINGPGLTNISFGVCE